MQNGFTPCVHCPLRTLTTFVSATDSEIAFIQSFKRQEPRFEAGSQVVVEGAQTNALYTLLEGMAFRFRTLKDGRRQILNFLFPGDLIGLQERITTESPHGVEALSTLRLCTFSPDRLWDLYRNHPELGYDITWLSAHEEYIVDENLLSVGRRSASERVAMLLIHIAKRAEATGLCADGSVPFPINQQHIADALGLSLVHTNKTLRRLEKLGLHRFDNGRLRILKPAALRRLADYYALPLRPRPLI